MRKIWLLFAAALSFVPTVIAEATPASASVSGTCTTYWYTNPSRMFSQCTPGTLYRGFFARISCSNLHTYDGPYQTRPGPWYGSMATCPAGTTAKAGTIIFQS